MKYELEGHHHSHWQNPNQRDSRDHTDVHVAQRFASPSSFILPCVELMFFYMQQRVMACVRFT
jgi:hypothetical protein